MWSGILGSIYHMSSRIRDEAETPGPLRLGILHDDHVDDLSPIFEVFLQRIISRAVVQPPDEQLANMFRLLILQQAESSKRITRACGRHLVTERTHADREIIRKHPP